MDWHSKEHRKSKAITRMWSPLLGHAWRGKNIYYIYPHSMSSHAIRSFVCELCVFSCWSWFRLANKKYWEMKVWKCDHPEKVLVNGNLPNNLPVYLPPIKKWLDRAVSMMMELLGSQASPYLFWNAQSGKGGIRVLVFVFIWRQKRQMYILFPVQKPEGMFTFPEKKSVCPLFLWASSAIFNRFSPGFRLDLAHGHLS